MSDEIPLIPEPPDRLREAAYRGKLIPFVGAGASKLAGCPTWSELADTAFKCFIEQGRFSHAQLDQLGSQHPRVKLSIAVGLQERHQIKIDFNALLHPAAWMNDRKGRRLYSSLSRLGKTFVTTNYDRWLDVNLATPDLTTEEDVTKVADVSPTSRNVFHAAAQLTAANLNLSNTVLHLHGSVDDPAGMVVTTSDYAERYRNDRKGEENPVLRFLENLFRTKTVLFIGYGLSDLEILEYVILKTKELTDEGQQPKHFMLQGFFSHQRELWLSLRDYYRQCGIELLSYSMDRKGHDQLLDVVDAFAVKAPASQLMLADEFLEMEKMLDD